MTSKDYERTAKAIGAAFAEKQHFIANQETQNELFSRVLDQFALMFAEDNSRFDCGRFETACYKALDTARRSKREILV